MLDIIVIRVHGKLEDDVHLENIKKVKEDLQVEILSREALPRFSEKVA